MRQIIILIALLAFWPGYVHAQINQDTVSSDVPGGGGSGGGGLSSEDIDTLAELNNIITPDVLGTTSSQSMTNKTIDAAANTIKILKGADCTAFDAAVDGQYCWDTDDDLLYVCETADVCDTSDEWDAVASTSTPSVQSIEIADSGDGNVAVDNDTEITSTLVEVWCQDSDGCELHLSNTNAVTGQQVTVYTVGTNDVLVTGQSAGSPVLGTTCSGAGALLPPVTTELYKARVKFIFALAWREECITNPILGSVPLADVATSADSADDLDCTDCVALSTETSGNYVGNVATTSPLSGGSAGSEGASLTLTIANAAADGSTKGAASFTANDFDASSGNVSIDYTNGQAASTSTKGFLTSTDWDTFNAKLDAADIDTFAELDTIVADETLVNTNDAQTLTNKTISGADNTLSNIPWASLTGVPAFRKTLYQLRPQAYEPPASSFATLFSRNGHPGLSFDGDVCAIWTFVLPNTYGGNGVTVDIWTVSSATSGDLDWDVSFELIGTSQDIDSDSFATAKSGDNNNNNATSGIPTLVSIAFGNSEIDSCVSDALCRVRICRDDTSDTTAATNGAAVMIGGQIRETP